MSVHQIRRQKEREKEVLACASIDLSRDWILLIFNLCMWFFLISPLRSPEQSICLLLGSVPFCGSILSVTFKKKLVFKCLRFFLIHPILQKFFKSFLSNWENHRCQGERSPGICGMHVIVFFLLLSFSQGSCGMFEFHRHWCMFT